MFSLHSTASIPLPQIIEKPAGIKILNAGNAIHIKVIDRLFSAFVFVNDGKGGGGNVSVISDAFAKAPYEGRFSHSHSAEKGYYLGFIFFGKFFSKLFARCFSLSGTAGFNFSFHKKLLT